ncbi:polysaccharide pyruvyl transferase family protein [Evansella halocellulosilytica]|uniref:polysaccharide pyruvyl transferase family protein n=1 Tax=Evansella halocellulosilytica TaxID=2011013 RepID=UPI000BB9046E|nr:polysaccharide pyruvyl transferase family protein [Evansella halocellulosilytica]
MKKIGIIGSFSGTNIGDTIVLETILKYFSQKDDSLEFYIPTYNKNFIENYFSSYNIKGIDITLRSLSMRFFGFGSIKNLMKCDIIVTTAGICFDKKILNFRYNFIISLLPVLFIMKLIRKKIFGLCIGVIKPESKLGEFIMKNYIGLHDEIILRNPQDKTVLEKFGYENFSVSSDIVFINDTKYQGIKNIKNSRKKKIAINLTGSLYNSNKGDISGKICDVISEYIESNNDAYFYLIPTSKGDMAFNQSIYNLLPESGKGNVEIIPFYKYNSNEVNTLLQECDYVIGMRMHSLILALINNVPVISLDYSPKVTGLMHQFNIIEYSINISKDINILNINLLQDISKKLEEDARLRKRLESEMREIKGDILHRLDQINY